MIMWMYEQVQPRETKEITTFAVDDMKINRLSVRKTIFVSFDILCGGKKKILPHSKWKLSRDGNYYIDIPEKLLTRGKSIKLYARNMSVYPQCFDGWFSEKVVGQSIAVDQGWQIYEEPGTVIVNPKAIKVLDGYNANWNVQPMNNPQAGVFYWDYKYPAPMQDPYIDVHQNCPTQKTALRTVLDTYVHSYGIIRLPEETDDELTARLKHIVDYPMKKNDVYADIACNNEYERATKLIYDWNNTSFEREPRKEDPNKSDQSGQYVYEQKIREETTKFIGEPATPKTATSIKKTISDAMTKAFKSFIGTPTKRVEYKKAPFGHCNSANDGCDASSCFCHCSWCRDVKKYRSIA